MPDEEVAKALRILSRHGIKYREFFQLFSQVLEKVNPYVEETDVWTGKWLICRYCESPSHTADCVFQKTINLLKSLDD